jgi:hypothetical protein
MDFPFNRARVTVFPRANSWRQNKSRGPIFPKNIKKGINIKILAYKCARSPKKYRKKCYLKITFFSVSAPHPANSVDAAAKLWGPKVFSREIPEK